MATLTIAKIGQSNNMGRGVGPPYSTVTGNAFMWRVGGYVPVIDPVSEFGIGIMSVFMIAESFVVESRALPVDPLNPPPSILFEVPTAYDYFVQRPSKRTEIGTSITVFLN